MVEHLLMEKLTVMAVMKAVMRVYSTVEKKAG